MNRLKRQRTQQPADRKLMKDCGWNGKPAAVSPATNILWYAEFQQCLRGAKIRPIKTSLPVVSTIVVRLPSHSWTTTEKRERGPLNVMYVFYPRDS